jgi:hypothetical protein
VVEKDDINLPHTSASRPASYHIFPTPLIRTADKVKENEACLRPPPAIAAAIRKATHIRLEVRAPLLQSVVADTPGLDGVAAAVGIFLLCAHFLGWVLGRLGVSMG